MNNRNITWHNGSINDNDRRKILDQKGMVIWLTGLSASGKSTIAAELEKQLLGQSILSYRLDGDNLRFGLNKDLGFSVEDRKENIRRTAEVANILKDAGLVVVASFITPTEELRNIAKEIIKDDFIEVYVKADIQTCIKRDPKGLYKKALAGEIDDFTGVSSEFEEPRVPDLIVDTNKHEVNCNVKALLEVVNDYQDSYKRNVRNLNEILKITKDLAVKAGEAIMSVYDNEDIQVEYKDDKSPLTLADKKSNEIIVTGLRKEFDSDIYAILTEEEKDDLERLNKDWCFVIDPLDGTKEFIKRNGEFTVNIALSYKGESILGVIYVPVTKELYYAAKGYGAYLVKEGKKEKLNVSNKNEDICLVKSRSHNDEKMDKLIEKFNIKNTVSIGSSLKGCLVAKGEAEVYYRFGYTMEWDTAAMQCIVEEAGGIFKQMNDEEMRYNRKNSLNDKGFYIINDLANKLN